MESPEWLQPALGYLELNMYDEVGRELDELTPAQRESLEVLKIRVSVALDQKNHSTALEWCRELCDRYPEEHVGFIQGAYCLHEIGLTEQAQAWLQSGPATLQSEPVYYYNLGCYDLALGHVESACAWLAQAIEMEPSYYDDALSDPDIQPILQRVETMRKTTTSIESDGDLA